MLPILNQVVQSPNYHIRITVLPFLQIFAFNHTFKFSKSDNEQIINLANNLLSDSNIEVREMASISLGSLLRNANVDVIKSLKEHFTKLAQTPIKKN